MTRKKGPPSSIVLGVTAKSSLILVTPLAAALAHRGWDVTVVSGEEGELKASVTPNAGYIAIPMERRPAPLKDVVGLLSWVRFLASKKPEVVMVGTPKASLLALLAARMVGVETRIYHLRGLRLESTPPGVKRRVLEMLEKLTIACSTSLLAVSRSLSALVLDLGLAKERSVDVVGAGSSKGVDVAKFEAVDETRVKAMRKQVGIVPELPVICFVGRISQDKGVEDLAVASDLLLRWGAPHQLVVAGPNAEHDSKGLAEDLRRLSTPDRPVSLPGLVEDVPALMQASHIHCLPTRREGFPNVVLEASAAGVPTVTTNATGAIDSVVDGETGLITEVSDPVSLAQALSTLLGDADLRHEMGRRALHRVRAEFDQEQVIEGICDYIEAAARR